MPTEEELLNRITERYRELLSVLMSGNLKFIGPIKIAIPAGIWVDAKYSDFVKMRFYELEELVEKIRSLTWRSVFLVYNLDTGNEDDAIYFIYAYVYKPLYSTTMLLSMVYAEHYRALEITFTKSVIDDNVQYYVLKMRRPSITSDKMVKTSYRQGELRITEKTTIAEMIDKVAKKDVEDTLRRRFEDIVKETVKYNGKNIRGCPWCRSSQDTEQ